MSLYAFSSDVAAVHWYKRNSGDAVCSVVIKGGRCVMSVLGFGDHTNWKPSRIRIMDTGTREERFLRY